MNYTEKKIFLQSLKELKGLTIYEIKEDVQNLHFTACDDNNEEGWTCYYGTYNESDGLMLDFAGLYDDYL